jgi:hypothetical protein
MIAQPINVIINLQADFSSDPAHLVNERVAGIELLR